LQTLTTALDDSNAQVQESAIEAIARIGPHAKSAIPKLIKFLYSEDVALRTMAIWALQRVGSEAVAELQRVLQSPILHAKLAAAHVLNGIGPSAAAAAPALLDTLLDHDWQVRREAAWALYRLGPNGARYIPNSMIEILINALQDHQWNIRFCLIHVLGWLGPKSKDMTGWYGSQKLTTAQALQKFAKDPDQRVSKAARHALNLVIKPLSQPTPQ
jgi:HEAT repeat protein